MDITFITGNQEKAEYLARLLDIEIAHQKIELHELQATDLHEIVEHKVRQAYEIIKKPVLVEDVSLEFTALDGLPGPFIKFFVDGPGLAATAKLLDSFPDRSATAKCTFGYFDGTRLELIDGSMKGEIATTPRGDGGYGWDKIFIPEGYGGRTRAELSKDENDETYQIIKPFAPLRAFLASIS